MTPVQTMLQTGLQSIESQVIRVNPGFACYGAFIGLFSMEDVQTAPKDTKDIPAHVQTHPLAQMLATAQLMAICAAMGMPFNGGTK